MGVDRRASLFSFVVAIAATFLVILTWPFAGEMVHAQIVVAVLGGWALLTVTLGVVLTWDQVTLVGNSAVVLVAIALAGPLTGMVMAPFGALVYVIRKKPRHALMNGAIFTISAGLAGLVYQWVGGAAAGASPIHMGVDLMAAGIVMNAVNWLLAAAYRWYTKGMHFTAAFGELARATRLNELGSVVVGVISAVAMASFGLLGLVAGVALFSILRILVARQKALMNLFLQGADALLGQLEAKDPATAAHCLRVGIYAEQIAHELGMGFFFCAAVKYNGTLHDVGKIEVRDELLKKPSGFTEEEYCEMQCHAAASGRLTKPLWMKIFRPRDEWASLHHERFDGTGYPRGLKGEEIPLGGRILAVADAFDAMTSDRPYHRGISDELALQELLRCAGTHFDPKVVEAFCTLRHRTLNVALRREVTGGLSNAL